MATPADKAAAAGEGCLAPPASVAGVVAAVVTVTFSRADYLRQHLDSLLAVHGRDPGNWCAAVGLGPRPPHAAVADAGCAALLHDIAICCRQHES